MAENEDGQDKSERATPKRIEDARKKGQVPRSVELGAAVVIVSAGGALYFLGGQLTASVAALMHRSLSLSHGSRWDEARALLAMRDSLLEALLACAPLLGVIFLAALCSPLALGGWNFSAESLGFKFERINPVAGLGRMFSARSFVDLLKAFAKFGLVALVAVSVVWSQADELLQMSREPVVGAMGHSLALAVQALLAMSAALALIAAVDVPFQLWQYGQNLRMTQTEVRQEHKESEGSPETRARIRNVQQAMARGRMMQEVPTASVVVTNPTHFAVALRYDESRNRAPVVVAKGADDIAAKIREIATASGVPLVSAPPLARALYRNVDLGVEIPAALYVAVAQVLTYVTQLTQSRRVGTPPPPAPSIDPAVEELGRRTQG
jgi:flagellar biosynthetic protein FlhB